MPMLSMKTKKPMLEMLAITDDGRLSDPNHPASAPTSSPSHPIHSGSARVVRMATAYSGGALDHGPIGPAGLITHSESPMLSSALSISQWLGTRAWSIRFKWQRIGQIDIVALAVGRGVSSPVLAYVLWRQLRPAIHSSLTYRPWPRSAVRWRVA
jgi:hypothetical protein